MNAPKPESQMTLADVEAELHTLINSPEVKTIMRQNKGDDHILRIAAAGFQLRQMLDPNSALAHWLAAYLLVTRARELQAQKRGERSVAA